MPSRRAVRITRQAISPRLAMRSDLIILLFVLLAALRRVR
jgi:hypothetical protein